ncbi:hypothetical protein FKP32DRAFT_460940 [Trametes sanguinea]|nr:hypothetical protein FKP32DRAFT_460940 [Trametes sanguinea]
MTQNLYRRDALASSAAALYALSLLPGAQAYCYIDGFGVERCTLSTGVRVAIAVASGMYIQCCTCAFGDLRSPLVVVAVLALLLGLRSMRARSQRRANLMYVGTVPANGAPGQAPPAYPAQGPGGYYAPNGAYTPQYPPQTYQQSPYSSVSDKE